MIVLFLFAYNSKNGFIKSSFLILIYKDVPFSLSIQHFAIWEKDTLNNGDIKEAHKEMSSVKSSKAFKVEMTI